MLCWGFLLYTNEALAPDTVKMIEAMKESITSNPLELAKIAVKLDQWYTIINSNVSLTNSGELTNMVGLFFWRDKKGANF